MARGCSLDLTLAQGPQTGTLRERSRARSPGAAASTSRTLARVAQRLRRSHPRRAPARPARRCRGSRSAPARNAATATSLAAFSDARARCRPPRSAARASARQRNASRSGCSNVSVPGRGQVEPRRRRRRRAPGRSARRRSARACRGGRGGPAARRRRSRTSAWTIDCGWTTTSIRSGGRPNRQWASITSSPLFISVAESTVILAPIRQVGMRQRLLGRDARQLGRRARPRNGPPEAVSDQRARPRRAPSPAQALEERRVLAVDRQRAPPPLRGRGVEHQRAAGDQALLVGQRDVDAAPRARPGSASSPAAPTTAFSTMSRAGLGGQPATPSRAGEHLAVEQPRRALGRGRVGQGASLDPHVGGRRPEPRPARAGGERDELEPSGCASHDVERLTPIEPVAPSTATRTRHRVGAPMPQPTRQPAHEVRRRPANSSASIRSSTPPWPAEQAARVLHADVALDERLEQVAERRGEAIASRDQQRLTAATDRSGWS